jgi:hypothetical protein
MYVKREFEMAVKISGKSQKKGPELGYVCP